MNSRMSTEENNDISKLELLSVVGFAGKKCGFKYRVFSQFSHIFEKNKLRF